MSRSISYHPDELIDPEAQHQFNNHTKMVTVDNWVEAILDVSPERIQNWSACLSYEKLLHPSTSIMKNLQEYCGASWWNDHLIAWTAVVNAIISQSSRFIPDLPSLPLPLIFMRDDIGYRVPDVVITVSSAAIKTSKHKDELSKDFDCWSQALGCVEFTSDSNTQLEGMYDALVSRLSESGGPTKTSFNFTSDDLPPVVDVSQSMNGRKRKASSELDPTPDSSSRHPFKRLKTDDESTENSITDSQGEAAARLVRYARKLLAGTSGTRAHSLQFLVDGPRLMLWYYDAGGIIHSEWMDWIDDLPKFAAIIIAFASLDIRGWGIGNIPNLRPPPDVAASTGPLRLPKSLSGFTLTMDHRTLDGSTQKVKVTLQNKLFSPSSLDRRRTIVYEVTTEPEISKKPLVLKMSMQTGSRTPESEFLEHARKSGVDHVPEMHMWSNKDEEWRLSDGVWGKLFPDNEGDKMYEDRCQRLIVCTKYEPVEDVVSYANLHSLMMQLVDCIHDLRYKAHILHRDISLGNLMCEKLDDGSIKLILNDFDLAAMVDDHGLLTVPSTWKHRGTLPFMAHELIKPSDAKLTTHSIRHDLESVFMVALWVAITLGETKVIARRNWLGCEEEDILNSWECGRLEDISLMKTHLIQLEDAMSYVFYRVDMGVYQEWISNFWMVLNEGCRVYRDVRFASGPLGERWAQLREKLDLPQKTKTKMKIEDMETIDGLITRESIQNELREWELEEVDSKKVEGFVPYFRVK